MLFFYENCKKGDLVIYQIVNTHNGRVYVGQTRSLRRRWVTGHKYTLMKNTHGNSFLQNDYNKCKKALGHDDFLEFRVLELVSSNVYLAQQELFWMRTFKENKGTILYNLTEEVNSRTALSQETKKKISEAKKRLYQTDRGKKLIRDLATGKAGKTYEEMYGQEEAKQIKEKIRANKLIEMNKPEVKENLHKLLAGKTYEERFGKDKAREIKLKTSLARKGKYLGKESSRYKTLNDICLLAPDGTKYTKIDGIKEFASLHGLSPNHLSELLAGKRNTHKGWKKLS